MNYLIHFDTGELYEGSTFVKATAKDENGKRIKESKCGYGVSRRDAINDFIRRNAHTVIDLVFKENK